MVVGEIDENTRHLNINFVSIDEKEFTEAQLDISEISSFEELIEKINEIYVPINQYAKIILIGSRKLEINSLKVLKYVQNPNIIKIKDCTKLEIDLEKLKKQNSLKGIFVKILLEKRENEPENADIIDKVIEIGLESF